MTSLTALLGPSLQNTPSAKMSLCFGSATAHCCATPKAATSDSLLVHGRHTHCRQCCAAAVRSCCNTHTASESSHDSSASIFRHFKATPKPLLCLKGSLDAVQRCKHEDHMAEITCKGLRRTSAAGLAVPVCSRRNKLHHILCQNVNCLFAALPSAFCCQTPAPPTLWHLKADPATTDNQR